jgi:DnaJ-domain-containing protein 1
MSLAAGGLAVFVGTLAPLLLALTRTPAEFEPLRVDSEQMWRWVDEGENALARAAEHARRFELQRAVELQSQIAAMMIMALVVYFFWLGLRNGRLRGWSPFFWIAGVGLAFFAPALAPSLTPARLDYLTTFWLETEVARRGANHARILPPDGSLAARAFAAAAAASFVALCAHDVAHRLREALWEFGFLADEDEGYSRTARPYGRARFRAGPRRAGASTGSAEDADARRFGQRAPGELATMMSDPEARACATLGVRLGASKAEIERAYRTKMKRAHPDHGGSVARAAALNQARDLLLPHG